MKKTIKRALAIMLCALSLLGVFVPASTAFALPRVNVESQDSTKYFEYISGSGTWEDLKTPHHWIVEDGALKITKLVRSPQGGPIRRAGDIVTRETFRNFILKIDFRLTEGANSGMKYFVQDNNVSCEFQFLDDAVHPDARAGIGGNRRLGSLYDLIPATQNYTLDPYGFNTAMLVVDGNHVEHWVNGTKVVEYERNTQMFDALINTSKFNGNTTFGTQPQGHILLQDHTDEVWFRNIKIKILD